MTLERKDIRAKLHPDYHAALTALADAERVDLGEFVERVLMREIEARVHAAKVVAAATARLGIAGNLRESAGRSGSGRE